MTFDLTLEMLAEIVRGIEAGDNLTVAAGRVGLTAAAVRRKALRQPNIRATLDRAYGARFDALPHGASRYVHRKCHCDVCRAGNAARQREYCRRRAEAAVA